MCRKECFFLIIYMINNWENTICMSVIEWNIILCIYKPMIRVLTFTLKNIKAFYHKNFLKTLTNKAQFEWSNERIILPELIWKLEKSALRAKRFEIFVYIFYWKANFCVKKKKLSNQIIFIFLNFKKNVECDASLCVQYLENL